MSTIIPSSQSFFMCEQSTPTGVIVMAICPRLRRTRPTSSDQTSGLHGSSTKQKSIVPLASAMVPLLLPPVCWVVLIRIKLPFFMVITGVPAPLKPLAGEKLTSSVISSLGNKSHILFCISTDWLQLWHITQICTGGVDTGL